ncbi:hypothetical protein GCM10010885_12020 [Alicyclobacillus cellulosilyticus]|uniref:Uncharacterized protein n=1 Tax=Alicyclobacillus cellulosilyticus TaxID=1003997 RepID=A0A917K7X5_9BACL|nr:hypothetical protein [Alicyclobacillus cellulosilyticus]GGJ04384.1 hypothetical protein GCM10010885_12020 [Alicyclobacillus cellulosilyticus]
MSHKRQVPTFRLTLLGGTTMEGPVVSPDRRQVAEHLGQLHQVLREHGAGLVYAGEWRYVPLHAVLEARRGQRWFLLPWPLVDDEAIPGEVPLP